MNRSVLFVCLGNICRSPTAHGVFEQLLRDAGLSNSVKVDSCGTGDWHLDHAPDRRAQLTAKQHGFNLSHLRSRLICHDDFRDFDYILAMDKNNLRDILALCPDPYKNKCQLFLNFAKELGIQEVPDPYYGGDDGFEDVLSMIKVASQNLLQEISVDI